MKKIIKDASLLTKYRSELMGICIIWIMLFHSSIQAPKSIIPRILWYLFISFGGGYGVDIFLICSGFGLTYSNMNREKLGLKVDWKKYYKKRMIRIIPTYLLVGIIYYLIVCNSFSEVIYNLSFANFIVEGRRDFWYVFAILICYMLFPVFGELKHKIDFRILLIVLTLITVFITMIMNIYIPNHYANWEILLWRVPCFWLGCYYGTLAVHNKSLEFYIATSVFTIVGFTFFMFTGLSRNTFTFLSPIIVVVFCTIFELIRSYLKLDINLLRFFGNISFELYLVHVSFGILLANYIYKFTGINWLSMAIYFSASFVIAINIHYLIKYFLEKTDKYCFN